MNTRDNMRKMLRELLPNSPRSHKCVYLINGAPGAGKTTLALQRMTERDLLIDVDIICAALQGTSELYSDHTPVLGAAMAAVDALYGVIERREGHWENAYVITASSNENAVRMLAEKLQADLIRVDTPREQCISQIINDSRRHGREDEFIEITNKWFDSRGK